MEVSKAQKSVQQNAAMDVKTDSEVSSDESEEEVVEEKKKQAEVIEGKKPESKPEQKPELEAEQKPVTKSRPVTRTPIPGTVWFVVQTNDGKHFFYNSTKRQSVWKMPEELKNRPDVDKLLPQKPEVKTEIKEEKDMQEEPPSKKIKLEAEVKEEKEESSSEATLEIVLEKESTNTVEVQTAENMFVVSLEDRKKQFKELLAEKDVKTTSTSEEELHKDVFDKDYTLLTSQKRKQVFEDSMKETAEEERQKRRHIKENSELYGQSLEESNLIVKFEAELKQEKEESSSEATQEIVLEKETTNTVEVQAAENMSVVSLEDRKKKFEELHTHRLEAGLKEEKEKSSSEATQEIVLEKKTTNAVEVQAAENMPVASLENRKKKFEEPHRLEAEVNEQKEESTSTSEATQEIVLEKETTNAVEVQAAENMPVASLENRKKKFEEPHRLEAEVNEQKEESSSEATQEIVLEKESTNAVEVQAAENMPVASLENRKKKFEEPHRLEAEVNEQKEESTSTSEATQEHVLEKESTKTVEIQSAENMLVVSLDRKKKFEEPHKFKAEEKEEKEESSSEATQEIVLEKETTNAVEVQAAEDMSVASLENRKKKFVEPHRLEAEVNEEKGESTSEATQEIVLEKESTNTVEVQAAENMPVASLENRKKKFEEPHRLEDEEKEESTSTSEATQEIVLEKESTKKVEIQAAENMLVVSLDRKKKLEEPHKFEAEEKEEKEESSSEATQEIVLEKETTNAVEVQAAEDMSVVSLEDRKMMFEEPHKLVAEVKEEKEESTSEATQEIVLEKESTKTVEIQAAEDMSVVSLEDRKKQFKELLAEKDVKTTSTWERELHKFEFDNSSTLLTIQERKQAFAEYVKDRAEEERMKRYGQIQGNTELFRQLLEESNLNSMSTFKSFAAANKRFHDKRFKVIDNFCDKEYMFQEYISELEQQETETFASNKKKIKNDFMKMLSETPAIDQHTMWSDLRKKLYLDPRYKAVGLASDRKSWFFEYLKTEKDVKLDFMKILSEIPGINRSTRWDDVKNKVSLDHQYKAVGDTRQKEWFEAFLKTAKDATSDDIKNKEEQVKSLHSSSLKEKDDSEKSQGEAAIEDFKKFPFEKVKTDFMKMLSETPGIDEDMSWRSVEKKLTSDPRYKAVAIYAHRRNWFFAYLRAENVVKLDFMKILSEIPGINRSTRWDDVKNQVSSDPQYKDVSDTRREEWFEAYLKTAKDATSDDIKSEEEQDKSLHSSPLKKKNKSGKRHEEVKNDFMKMLSETPGIAHYSVWSDVKKELYSDPRYNAEGNDSHRKNWFCDYLRAENHVKGYFMKILSEIPGINPSTRWDDVKNKVSSEPLYKDVSNTRQEEWFEAYLKTVKDATSDDRKNKEEHDKSLNSSSLKEKQESGKSSDDADIEDFKMFPIEKATSDDINKEEQDKSSSSLKEKDESEKSCGEASTEDFKKFSVEKATSGEIKNKEEEDKSLHLSSLTEKDESGKSHDVAIEDFQKFPVEKATSDDITNKEEQDKSSSSLKEKDESGKSQGEASIEDNKEFPVEKDTSDDITNKDEQDKSLHSSSLKEKDDSEKSQGEAAIEDFKKFPFEKATSDDIKNKVEQDKSSSLLKKKDKIGKSHGEVAIKDFKKFPVEKVTSDDIRKEEVQGEQLHSSSPKRKNTRWQNLRGAAIEDFKQFLVENVKDTKDLFCTFKDRFFKSPRWTMDLTYKEKKKLFDDHVYEIHKKNLEIVWSILFEMDLPLKADWSKVKKRIEADPRYASYTDSEDQLVDDYGQFMYEKNFKPQEFAVFMRKLNLKLEKNCSSQISSPQKKGQEVYSSL